MSEQSELTPCIIQTNNLVHAVDKCVIACSCATLKTVDCKDSLITSSLVLLWVELDAKVSIILLEQLV